MKSHVFFPKELISMPPPMMFPQEEKKIPKPKNLKDVPRYLRELLGGIFSRLLYIFRLVWEARPILLIQMVFMALFNGFFPLLGTFIAANLLQQVVYSFTGDSSGLLRAFLLQAGFTVVQSLVTTLNSTLTNIGQELVNNHVKIKIMEKAKEVDLASFDMPDFYSRMENASREAGSRPVMILQSSLDLVGQVIRLVSYLVVFIGLLSRLDWRADLLFVLFVLFNLGSAYISFHFGFRNFIYMLFRSKDRRKMDYYSGLLTNKDVVKELRLFHLSDLFISRYKTTFLNYFSGIKSLIWKQSGWTMGVTLGTTLLNMGLFYLVATNVNQVSDYTVYTQSLTAVAAALSAIINQSSGLYQGTLFIDNMITFMKEKRTVVPQLSEPVLPQRHIGHTIELRDVSFAYPGTTRMVLKHLNLTINAGETNVLVGLNGAGKTTLIKLITRLYDPTEGIIMLDGRDIRDYDVPALYKLFGIIFQDFGKYAVSIRENIAFGDYSENIDDEAIQAAAKQSGADEFIDNLPLGLDTPLMRYFEDSGLELSIGQWQKLSVARAFYADSDILILDEPTASLDAIAEQEIFRQFDNLRKDKTTIFVSHRLSSATTADKIIVLEDGEIIETGDHRTLMAQNGEYSRLFSTQAKRYLETADTVNPAFGGFPQGGFPGFPQGGMPKGGFPMPKGDFPKGGFPGFPMKAPDSDTSG